MLTSLMDYILIVVCWLPNLFPDRSWSFFSELQIYILNKLLKTSTYMSDSYFKSGVFQTELPRFFSPKTYCSFNLSILINNYFILLVAEVKKSLFFLFLLQPISNLSRNLIGCTFTYNYNPINLYSFFLHILYVFTQMSLS